jgi:hypothetical protein
MEVVATGRRSRGYSRGAAGEINELEAEAEQPAAEIQGLTGTEDPFGG